MAPAFGGPSTVTTYVATAVLQLLVTLQDIVVVPAATPVTTPVLEFTVATDVLLLVHEMLVPTAVALSRSVVDPTHIVLVPVIVPALGVPSMYSVAVTKQPVAVDVKVTVVDPALTPVRTPDEAFIVALALLTLHVCAPVVVFPSVIDDPTQTGVIPVIADGSGFTVIT